MTRIPRRRASLGVQTRATGWFSFVRCVRSDRQRSLSGLDRPVVDHKCVDGIVARIAEQQQQQTKFIGRGRNLPRE
jgi:hypothetical protein